MTSTAVSEETRQFIGEKVRAGYTAMEIRSRILQNDLPMPSENQLRVVIRSEKDLIKKGFKVSLGYIKQFCDDNKAVPIDDFEPFVLSSEIISLAQNKSFRYIITTKTLLMNATVLDNHLAVDATYKVMFQGFPLILIGSTDKFKKYHPFAVAVVSSEKEEDYKFIFREFKVNIETMFQILYTPKTLLADGALAIRNAFNSDFISYFKSQWVENMPDGI